MPVRPAGLRWGAVLLGVAVVFGPTSGQASEPALDFATQVAPLLEQHCLRCHSSANRRGELSLATAADLRRSGYLVAGDVRGSHLLDVVTAKAGERPAMPKEGQPLSDAEVALLRRWIAEGAAWPENLVLRERAKADASWWSLQPVRTVEPPAVNDVPAAWQVNPIDRFIGAKLAEQGLRPSPPADRRTLIRRLSFDLIGLPPSPDDVRAFVDDVDPQAYEHLVDRLLDSPHYGERWARHWLDIAHYADTHGFERDQRRDHAWRYRDYVIRSLNDDKPYDQFLREQIAGDVLAPDDDEAVIATGFLAAGPWDFVGQVETKSPELRRSARALDLDDMVTQVMTASVGMTVNCARCHDHKLDPISQREYYQLWAVFAGLKRGDRDVSARARREYDAEKERLEREINRVATEIATLSGQALDLADVVGGGNGFGSGRKGIGLDARTGQVQERPFGDLGNVQPGHYAACGYDFVDGVFVPAGGETQISSTGLKATDLPENSGKAWDMIRNGPVASQFSTQLGAVDYQSAGHSLLGLHANAGITFDLQAIRQATQAKGLVFSTVVGYGGRLETPSAEFRILLDGELKEQGKLGRHDTASIVLPIAESVRFLTLISTDGGDGYGHDQISFGDPRLAMQNSPQGSPEVDQRLEALRQARQHLEAARKELGAPPVFYGVIVDSPPPVHVLTRGDPESPADAVAPGALNWGRDPVVFGSADMPEGDRRRALADWIVDPHNPLTALVIVNRLWHWHFGRGLVGTPSDFGYGGERPSHPELLDWLATELLRSGWSLKHMHRLIVTSQTYQMTSRVDAVPGATHGPSPADLDSDNRLLWRMNPRRLEAEVVRDAVLVVTGKLNREMYGPGYRDFEYQEAYAPIYTYTTADSPDLWRRTVYRFVVRTTPDQFLTTLDCPDPANLTPQRNVTTTPLQSLALYNNEFMLRQAGYFVERIEREAGGDPEAQIRRAFALAFSRPPTVAELSLSSEFVARQGLFAFCRSLFNANEFVYVD